jgi:hypothetical protein
MNNLKGNTFLISLVIFVLILLVVISGFFCFVVISGKAPTTSNVVLNFENVETGKLGNSGIIYYSNATNNSLYNSSR